MSMKADFKNMMRTEGFEFIGYTGGGHMVWCDGEMRLTSPATPSDYRGIKNMKCLIRRKRRS